MARIAIAALLCFALAACDRAAESGAPASDASAPAPDAPPTPHRVAVCATASLRHAFEAIAARYESDHPGADVALHFDGGTQILDALNAGERCDVIALGDNSVMARVVSAGHTAVGSPAELARNRIAIAVAAGNPKQVKGLADFARPGLRIALGKRSASIGRHGYWVLSRQKIDPQPAVQPTTADGVLAAIASGDADAGIVYATSFAGLAKDAGVARIDVPEEQNTPALYSISVAREPAEPRGAEAFRALALGEAGQQILHDAGFLPIGAKPH
jgi:molybdate transport system substrate-binding protein